MTPEPTLAQWRERALVAEALLEERTQEAEKLRAEMEDLKAKQPAVSKGVRMGADFASIEARMLAQIMKKAPQWVGLDEMMAPQYIKDRAPPRRRSPDDMYLDELKKYAPQRNVEVSASRLAENGNVRIMVKTSQEELWFEIDRHNYEAKARSPMGQMNVALAAAEEIVGRWKNPDNVTKAELAIRLNDAMSNMRR